jgi:hypothetical protein
MEQEVIIKLCVKTGKTLTGTYEMLRTVYGEKALSRSNELEWLDHLNMGVRIFSMIKEIGILPLEMQTQLQ